MTRAEATAQYRERVMQQQAEAQLRRAIREADRLAGDAPDSPVPTVLSTADIPPAPPPGLGLING